MRVIGLWNLGKLASVHSWLEDGILVLSKHSYFVMLIPLFFWLNLELHIGCETCTNLLVLKQCYLFSEQSSCLFKIQLKVHELYVGFVLAFNLWRLLWKSWCQNGNYCGLILLLLWPYLFVLVLKLILNYL